MSEYEESLPPWPLIIMGRELGTFNGWDGDDNQRVFYNFKPTQRAKAAMELQGWQASEDLSFDSENGLLMTFDDEDKCTSCIDAIAALQTLTISQQTKDYMAKLTKS